MSVKDPSLPPSGGPERRWARLARRGRSGVAGAAGGRAPLVLLGAGVALGLVWRAIAAALAGRSDLGEQQVSADGSFFLLMAVAAVITAVAFLRRPGPRPVPALLVLLVGSVAASALAAALGDLTGGPGLQTWGGLVVWPWGTAMIVAASLAVRLLFPDPDGDNAPEADGPGSSGDEKR